MLRTSWAWPMRIGPLVKHRLPLRTWPSHLYLDQFRTAPDEVRGLRRLRALARLRRLPEPEHLTTPPPDEADGIVQFTGEGRMLAALAGHEALLRDAIRQVTRERWLRVADGAGDAPIRIHVRRSDFRTAEVASDFVNKGQLRTPLTWFVEALRVIRRELGSGAPALVVTDGRPEELRELLAEPAVRLMTPSSPLSDMLVLSRGKALIGSGGSTFSAWGSFLGEMPTVTHPGQSLRWFKIEPQRGQYVGELDPADPPAELLHQLRDLA